MFKILIVEDSPIFRRSLKEILCTRFPSLVVAEAADGKEALEQVEAAPPDLIFMDIKLPGVSGLELTKKIKTGHPKINIIILTNYDIPEYRQAAYQYGANYFISKSSSSRQEMVALVESIASDLGFDYASERNEKGS